MLKLPAGHPSPGIQVNGFCYVLPKLPTDTFVFQGYQGQWFIVIPSKDLMIARFGITNTPDWSMEDLVVDILGAIR